VDLADSHGNLNSVVDIHNHFVPADIPDFTSVTGDPRWPALHVDEEGHTGRIMQGERLYRAVRQPCWDTAARLGEMDEVGVDCQVMSPLPVCLTYWAQPDAALEYARHLNDSLAAAVARDGRRLYGLGTVPLQDPQLAVKELKRAVLDLGLAGVEIGTVINGLELDETELRPFFHAAEDLRAPIFVHSIDSECATRVSTPIVAGGVGALTDTALAATGLVFGGVLRECPDLRVCLSHGGGTFPWAFPRLNLVGSAGRPAGELTPTELTRLLYVDSLVFDPSYIALLKTRFGPDHVVLGSDYPILPAKPGPQAIIDQALAAGVCTADEARAMRGENAWRFLGKGV
jgi:aminocarboxymuconate-semialdehyde decarboxylase